MIYHALLKALLHKTNEIHKGQEMLEFESENKLYIALKQSFKERYTRGPKVKLNCLNIEIKLSSL